MNINWGKIASGVGGFFGNTASGLLDFGSTIATNMFNSQEAQKSRDWQEQMSNTAHQREVADLRKAGLNPILTATGGNGASSPVGATATAVIPPRISEIRQSGNQTKLAKSQVHNTDIDSMLKQAQKGLINEQEHNAFQEGMNLFDQRDQLRAGTAKIYQDIENSKTLTNAQALNLLYGSEAQKTSAAAAMKGSIAAQTNAQAAIINAQQSKLTQEQKRKWYGSESVTRSIGNIVGGVSNVKLPKFIEKPRKVGF